MVKNIFAYALTTRDPKYLDRLYGENGGQATFYII